ncbi:hypothetical protein Tco_0046237 [Tanacetum coccineum]
MIETHIPVSFQHFEYNRSGSDDVLNEAVDGDGTIELPKDLTDTPPSLESVKLEDVRKAVVKSETRTRSAKSLVLRNSTTKKKKKKVE